MIIIAIVITFNIICSNYTSNSVSDLECGLNQMRQDLENENKDEEKINKDLIMIKQSWKEKYQKLAFYIEHDELEKIENDIYAITADIETEEYEQAIENIEKCNEELEKRNFQLINELNGIKNSKSWKILHRINKLKNKK